MQCEKSIQDIRGIDFPYSSERDKCPIDYSLLLLSRLKKNLCGQGVFCRDGAAQLEKVLSDIAAGEGKSGDIDLINEICTAIAITADCDLSRSAAKHIIDLIGADRETWESHISRRRCPSLRCARLSLLYIDPATCDGCGKCTAACPECAIEGGPDMIHVISRQLCTRCGKCEPTCPAGAIRRADVAGVLPKTPAEPVPVGSFKAIVPGTGLRKGLRK